MSRDPRKLTMARSLQNDVLSVTAADIQTLAQRYLRADTRWSAIVLAKGVPAPQLPARLIVDAGTSSRAAASPQPKAASAN